MIGSRRAVVIPALVAVVGLGACASAAAATERPEPQQEYWAQFDRKDWSGAVAAAEKLVTAARAEAAQEPLALADALSLLGNAQLGQADYVAAEAAFKEALEIVERNTGAASPKLFDPLRGLGYTFAASGRHDEAIAPLDRALLIARRSHGLFDASQQGVLRHLATSLTRSGRGAEAERHIHYLLQIGERTYGRLDPRQVPLMCFAGDWYADIGNFAAARMIYRQAIEIVEKKLGRTDPTAVEPLRALARSYTQELYFSILGIRTVARERVPTDANGTSNESKPMNPRYLSSDGQQALDRALNILEAQPAAGDALVAALIQTGDWFQIKHQPDKALRYYRRAASLSSAASAPESAAGPRPLSFPVLVYYPTPPQAKPNVALPPDQVRETFVEVEFTVSGDGDVTNAKVTDRSGTSRQAYNALQAIRAARFRPKFVNGEPVTTSGITHREIFRIRQQTPAQGDES